MSKKFSVNGFTWIKNISQFNEGLIKSYNEDSNEGYFFEVYVQYPKELQELYNGLPFLSGRIKIENVEKRLSNFHDKKEYAIHIRN